MPELVLNDNSIMPFGKYKNRKLANVPASYLEYLRDQIKTSKHQPSSFDKALFKYLDDNYICIQKEIEDEKSDRHSSF